VISEANEKSAIVQFGWIPEGMLKCLFRKDATLELRTQISTTIKHSILPLPAKSDADENAWVDRLFLVISHLDETALKALERLTGLTGYAK
jgi:sister-chromatid-cohesion protein PDS5